MKSCSSAHFRDEILREEGFHSFSLSQYTHGNANSYHQKRACMMYPDAKQLYGLVSASYCSDASMRMDCCWYPGALFGETMCLT